MTERFVTRGFVGRRAGRPGLGERGRADPAGPVPDDRLPGPLGRADPAHPARPLVVHDRGPRPEPMTWTWDEFMALPSRDWVVDISCVTKWTNLDMRWRGVSVDTLLERVELDPKAAFVIAYSDGGYTTNLPLGDVLNNQAFVAYEYDGKPLAPEHGGPARLVVPARYFWKSAKWVRGLRIQDRDEPGLLGVARLPQPRRPVARRALQRRLRERAMVSQISWQLATVIGDPRRDADRPDPSRSALPEWPGHRAGQHVDLRLTAEDGYSVERSVLDRVRARARRRGRHHRRADRGRRGLAVPPRGRGRRRPARGARPDRRLLRLGGGARRTAAARRGRLGRGAADGDGPPPRCGPARTYPTRLLFSSRGAGRHHLPRRARPSWPRRDDGFEVVHTLTRSPAAGLDRLRPPHRRPDARRGRWSRSARRLAPTSADRRRSSRSPPTPWSRLGLPADRDPDRALRADGHLIEDERWTTGSTTMRDDPVGRADASTATRSRACSRRVFGGDMTAVPGRCATATP